MPSVSNAPNMATTSKAQLEVVLKATDQASDVLRQVGRETEHLNQKANDFNTTMKAAFGAISAYVGTRGILSLIRATEESSLQLAQARFHLAGYGKEVDENFRKLVQWSAGVQKAIGAGDEYAVLVASKLLPRVKNLSKAQEYANVLLRGERIGMLNAQEAANMLMRAVDGNERALRFLLEQMNIATPEFVSLETLFEELRRRTEEGEKALSPFATQWRILSENLGEFKERAGTPIVGILASIAGGINQLIDRFPILGKIVSVAMAVIATALVLAGTTALYGFIAPVLAGIVKLGAAIFPFLLTPWGIALMAIVAAAIYAALNWDKTVALISKAWEALKFTWNAVIDFVSEKMLVFYNALIERWTSFKEFWKGLWESVRQIIESAMQWISDKVSAIVEQANRAISAVSSLASKVGGGITSTVKSVAGVVTGKRQHGGSVEAGGAYLVGERGPELFMPRTAGAIIPNAGGTILIDMRSSVFLDRLVAVEIGDQIIKRLKELHRIGF